MLEILFVDSIFFTNKIKNKLNEFENKYLCAYAQKSADSAGRAIKDIDELDIRLPYQKDKDKIIHSKAFRRLKGKTQVFLFPIGDHYRTRLTHTLEVASISRIVARALFLNEDLAEAVALGHDLGHTPFGHLGEKALSNIVGGFSHYEQSKRIAEYLNLSYEVIDGIYKHSKGKGPILDDNIHRFAGTIEGQIVRVADIIAYLNHDIDDAIRAGLITQNMIPKKIIKVLGTSIKDRYTTMINDLVFSTQEKIENNFSDSIKRVHMSSEVILAMQELRNFLFHEVYENKIILSDYAKILNICEKLFEHFYKEPELMLQNMELTELYDKLEIVICDYISGMTDNFAITTYKNLFLPNQW